MIFKLMSLFCGWGEGLPYYDLVDMQLTQLQKSIRQQAPSVLFIEPHKFFISDCYFYFSSI